MLFCGLSLAIVIVSSDTQLVLREEKSVWLAMDRDEVWSHHWIAHGGRGRALRPARMVLSRSNQGQGPRCNGPDSSGTVVTGVSLATAIIVQFS